MRNVDEIRKLIHQHGENDCFTFPTPLVIKLQSMVYKTTLELKRVWINESRKVVMETVSGNPFELGRNYLFNHDVIDGLLVELRKQNVLKIKTASI